MNSASNVCVCVFFLSSIIFNDHHHHQFIFIWKLLNAEQGICVSYPGLIIGFSYLTHKMITLCKTQSSINVFIIHWMLLFRFLWLLLLFECIILLLLFFMATNFDAFIVLIRFWMDFLLATNVEKEWCLVPVEKVHTHTLLLEHYDGFIWILPVACVLFGLINLGSMYDIDWLELALISTESLFDWW